LVFVDVKASPELAKTYQVIWRYSIKHRLMI
jgi:hypothetical protein